MRKMKYVIAAISAMFISATAFAADFNIEQKIALDSYEVLTAEKPELNFADPADTVVRQSVDSVSLQEERSFNDSGRAYEFLMSNYQSPAMNYRHEDPHRS